MYICICSLRKSKKKKKKKKNDILLIFTSITSIKTTHNIFGFTVLTLFSCNKGRYGCMTKNPIIASKAPRKVLITFVISFVRNGYFPVCKVAPTNDSIKHARNAATVKISI